MEAENRITEKMVAAKMLSKIEEARAILASGLADLRYLHITVDGKPDINFSMDCWALVSMSETLQRVEEQLCRI